MYLNFVRPFGKDGGLDEPQEHLVVAEEAASCLLKCAKWSLRRKRCHGYSPLTLEVCDFTDG